MPTSIFARKPNTLVLFAQARLCGILAAGAWVATAVVSMLGVTGDLLIAGFIAAGLFTILFMVLALVLRPRGTTKPAALMTTLVLLAIGANVPLLARVTGFWPVLLSLTCAAAAAISTKAIAKAPRKAD